MLHKNKYNVFIIVFLLQISITPHLFSQKTTNSSGEYTLRIEKNQTIEQAKELCLEQARINAIENAFGRIILNGNQSLISNSKKGNLNTTNSYFNFISDSYVNGVWLKDLREPIIQIDKINEDFWVKVSVIGEVKEIKPEPVLFKVKTLNCPNENCLTETFNNNQNFFVSFTSPIDGYLNIFLEDIKNGITSKIFPYHTDKISIENFKIKKNNNYILFSKKEDKFGFPELVDELEFYLEDNSKSEIYKLIILFSKNDVNNPILNNNQNFFKDKFNIKEGYKFPEFIEINEFNTWFQKKIIREENIQIEKLFLEVNPN